jgi:hypothetical protein
VRSLRATALMAVLAFLMLPTSQASACSCRESTTKEKFSKSDLVIRGRMKTVTYGNVMPFIEEIPRATRGEIEIEKVLKGTFKEKTISVYTGTGMGDCGLLGLFLNMAVYYEHEKFSTLELGLTKSEFAGQSYYAASMCGYVKGPKDEDE